MSWHVTDQMAAAYAEDRLPESDAWSLEKHVEGCSACAGRVSAAVAATAAAPRLAAVRTAVLDFAGTALAEAAPAAPVERRTTRSRAAALRIRLMWAAGPALRGPWLLSIILVILGAVTAGAATRHHGGGPLLVALAPVLPLAGVAASYGPYADPMHEVTVATPGGGLRLLLIRTTVVLATAVPLVTAAGWALPHSPGVPGPWAWLLPGLALTLGSLWLSSYIGCRLACALLGGGWLLAMAALSIGPDLPADERLASALSTLTAAPAAQSTWGAAVVLGAGLLVARRHAFDHISFHRLERL
ncbi:zf-HC2 domain-containing protein [Streptomyces sp. 3N207]|uniref:zf-HC2 domain-containing protein n=1 Tax=Streptomyces sp. 3N207 TaxID=3457417 RepID=UPI003FCF246D